MSTLRVNTIQDQAGTGNASAGQIGVGQTWQNVTASRAASVNYTNTTGRPIQISVGLTGAGPGSRTLTIGGLNFARSLPDAATSGVHFDSTIPPGAVYSFNGTFSYWYELR